MQCDDIEMQQCWNEFKWMSALCLVLPDELITIQCDSMAMRTIGYLSNRRHPL